MNNSKKIIIGVVGVIVVIAVAIVIVSLSSGKKSKLGEIKSAEDLVNIVTKLYEGKEEELPSLDTNVIDVNDSMNVKAFTGLENGNDLEYLVASEPLISSQAYSLVLAKVKNGVDANKVAKDISEKVDYRKWICVSAEKIYSTNSGDIVCLVMSSDEWAKPVYEKFKELAGNVGKEYTKTTEEADLPQEMY